MTSISRIVLLSLGLAAAATCAACAPPHRDVAAADVPKLTSLKELMDVQATIADPQFKKVGDEATYTDADYAAFEEVSNRILATSTKAKNGKASSDGLVEMKKVCKECHSKHR